MKKIHSNTLRTFVAAALMFSLGACVSAGEVRKHTAVMPRGERLTIVDHNIQGPRWLQSTDSLAMDFVVKGDVTDEQLKAVAAVEDSCKLYAHDSQQGKLVAVLSDGILYAVAGFIGVGGGSQAFPGAKFFQYGAYGAGAGATSGMAYAILSDGKTYAFDNCAVQMFDADPQYKVHPLERMPY
jgi:hypothetical protein